MVVSTTLFTVVILKGHTSVIYRCNIPDIQEAINEFWNVWIQYPVQIIEICQLRLN